MLGINKIQIQLLKQINQGQQIYFMNTNLTSKHLYFLLEHEFNLQYVSLRMNKNIPTYILINVITHFFTPICFLCNFSLILIQEN